MLARIRFQRLVVRSFRNIEDLLLEPCAGLNVVSGGNGQGKTSLLEALYFAATTRSFRTERLAELVTQNNEVCSVRAEIEEGTEHREQRAAISGRSRSVTLAGNKPASLSAYAVRTPVVAFHPGDLSLVAGPAAGRRLLLDRLALYLDPTSIDARSRYTRALKERQRVLDERGPHAADLEVFEQLSSEYGARYARARRRAATELVAALVPALSNMAAPGLELRAEYRPGGTDDPAAFHKELAARRGLDLRRRSASFGPQRDELELFVDGRSARHHASQGQQRVITLSLKVAELSCVREARGVHPVLLLDDVSSELDSERTDAVFGFLRATESQIFVTTTRPELFTSQAFRGTLRADFELVAGRLAPARSPS